MEYENLREKYGDVIGLGVDAYWRIRRRMGSVKEQVEHLQMPSLFEYVKGLVTERSDERFRDCFGRKQLLEMVA